MISYAYADDGATTISLSILNEDAAGERERDSLSLTMLAAGAGGRVSFGEVGIEEALAILLLPCRLDYVLSFGPMEETIGIAELQARQLDGGVVELRLAYLADGSSQQLVLTLTAKQRTDWYGMLQRVVPVISNALANDPAVKHLATATTMPGR